MTGQVEPPPTVGKPLLRPRWSAWFAWFPGLGKGELSPAALLSTLFWIGLFSYQLERPGASLVVLGIWAAIALVVRMAQIMREYVARPPVMCFWMEDPSVVLTVREQRSGKVLLRSAEPSLAAAELAGLPLHGAVLRGLDLEQVDLENRDLCGADLRDARLLGANLSGADLRGANLEGAHLDGADLSGADLRHARLATATIGITNFRAADLRGADFVGRGTRRVLWNIGMGAADFRGACYDSSTRWPAGFDHPGRGCLRGPELTTHLPIPAEAGDADAATLPLPSQAAE